MVRRLIETVLPEKDGAEIRELLKELKVLEHRQVGELPPQEESTERLGREGLGRKVFDDRFLSRRGSLEVPVIGAAFTQASGGLREGRGWTAGGGSDRRRDAGTQGSSAHRWRSTRERAP